ncbi:MAG: helix-turn-helix transcriptional regulator [Acidithiobacillus sp.]
MWLNLSAQSVSYDPGPDLKCNALSKPPARIIQPWRDQGWLRQLKVYRLHRHAKGWQTHCWWRYPAGRWPAPPRELIIRAQREFSSGTLITYNITSDSEIASVLLCNAAPTQLALFHMDIQRVLSSEEVQNLQMDLKILYQTLEIETPFHPELSPTDFRIAQLLLHGIGQHQIALAIGQSESTVRSRIAVLCRRYGVTSRRMLMIRLLKTIGRKRPQKSTAPHADNLPDWSEQHV